MLIIALILSGCIRAAETNLFPTPSPEIGSQTQLSTTLQPNYEWDDANAYVKGICFETALYYTGKVFVVTNGEQHTEFYDLMDASGLCRHPVTRYPFEFEDGRKLIGLWSFGTGCAAQHEITDVKHDATQRIIVITLKFSTYGSCNFELVRPFWIAINDSNGYSVEIDITS